MAKATVHCLPSFGETPGLANLEAAAAGCPLVVSNRGAEREYFGDLAEYCDPLDPDSIRVAVLAAAKMKGSARTSRLQKKVRKEYSWQSVAFTLNDVYNRVLAEMDSSA
jgi:glycosyltransferase involved in cell wall biosynthesis